MLSLTTEKATLAPVRAESGGKQKAQAKGRKNYELLILLKEMKNEMKRNDEQLREELRWRDNHQA